MTGLGLGGAPPPTVLEEVVLCGAELD
jgi:hypothetical protein